MCCLKNEQDTYEYLNSRLPSIGDRVTLPDGGQGEVKGINVLRQLVKVVVDLGDEKEMREYSVDELKLRTKQRRDIKVTEEEMLELADLEDKPEVEEEKKENRPRNNNNYKRNRNRGKGQRNGNNKQQSDTQ